MDAAHMMAIARGCGMDELAKVPAVMTNISINSPRVFDTEMSSALIALAGIGQPIVVTPFTLMGAMTPATLAGALMQQHAEALFRYFFDANCASRGACCLWRFHLEC